MANSDGNSDGRKGGVALPNRKATSFMNAPLLVIPCMTVFVFSLPLMIGE